MLARIIERERPDAVLPTLGGQTGLNLAMELHDGGVLEANGTELIGADAAAIATAASTALPPSSSIRNPACAANGWLVATAPLRAITADRRD